MAKPQHELMANSVDANEYIREANDRISDLIRELERVKALGRSTRRTLWHVALWGTAGWTVAVWLAIDRWVGR